MLIPLGLTGLTYIGIESTDVGSTALAPDRPLWKFGYDPANTIGGEKGGDIHFSTLETWFPPSINLRHINLHYVYIYSLRDMIRGCE